MSNIIEVRKLFDPKIHPAVNQSDKTIRAFGIEFQSRYGVIAELRQMINAVETWLPRGLFWQIEKMFFDSKSGCISVTMKERSDDLSRSASQIADILSRQHGDACLLVYVEDHNGERIAESDK